MNMKNKRSLLYMLLTSVCIVTAIGIWTAPFLEVGVIYAEGDSCKPEDPENPHEPQPGDPADGMDDRICG